MNTQYSQISSDWVQLTEQRTSIIFTGVGTLEGPLSAFEESFRTKYLPNLSQNAQILHLSTIHHLQNHSLLSVLTLLAHHLGFIVSESKTDCPFCAPEGSQQSGRLKFMPNHSFSNAQEALKIIQHLCSVWTAKEPPDIDPYSRGHIAILFDSLDGPFFQKDDNIRALRSLFETSRFTLVSSLLNSDSQRHLTQLTSSLFLKVIPVSHLPPSQFTHLPPLFMVSQSQTQQLHESRLNKPIQSSSRGEQIVSLYQQSSPDAQALIEMILIVLSETRATQNPGRKHKQHHKSTIFYIDALSVKKRCVLAQATFPKDSYSLLLQPYVDNKLLSIINQHRLREIQANPSGEDWSLSGITAPNEALDQIIFLVHIDTEEELETVLTSLEEIKNEPISLTDT
ncbi:hypothetical protein BLNAU_16142 [Blattamonas nauphoetae]|uniref:Uncharacterized protein n=1 Tax=Blattamonas nauphoetae TaxID=2049346 RepID=A0ABQ9XDI5_9EUKA|nr:hypothetical protein BLNAU_16142 [Blattamonas nauphoetae]